MICSHQASWAIDQETLAMGLLEAAERGTHDVSKRGAIPALDRQQFVRLRERMQLGNECVPFFAGSPAQRLHCNGLHCCLDAMLRLADKKLLLFLGLSTGQRDPLGESVRGDMSKDISRRAAETLHRGERQVGAMWMAPQYERNLTTARRSSTNQAKYSRLRRAEVRHSHPKADRIIQITYGTPTPPRQFSIIKPLGLQEV